MDNLKDIKDYADGFSPDDEFCMWVEAKFYGTSGVPEIEELWKDQLWKQDILRKVSGLRG